MNDIDAHKRMQPKRLGAVSLDFMSDTNILRAAKEGLHRDTLIHLAPILPCHLIPQTS